MKETIEIPVYWYEDENGYKTIDFEEMRSVFEYELKYLYLGTKKGKNEQFKKIYKQWKKTQLKQQTLLKKSQEK
jgi:hypothetical protein